MSSATQCNSVYPLADPKLLYTSPEKACAVDLLSKDGLDIFVPFQIARDDSADNVNTIEDLDRFVRDDKRFLRVLASAKIYHRVLNGPRNKYSTEHFPLT